MTLLQSHTEVTIFEGILDFIAEKKRVGFIVKNGEHWNSDSRLLETIQESILAQNGQFVSLNAKEFDSVSLSNVLLSELEKARGGKPFRIFLPILLQNSPQADTPFINRAILWQRLCDRLIEDDDTKRPTVLIYENFDLTWPKSQHEFARLIRFHATHRIRRSFLLTIQKESLPLLTSEIRELCEMEFEID